VEKSILSDRKIYLILRHIHKRISVRNTRQQLQKNMMLLLLHNDMRRNLHEHETCQQEKNDQWNHRFIFDI
jgi:hypothetical protein